MIAPPRYDRTAQKALRRAQRALARKHKGSTRRKKAVARLAKHHLHVANQRRTFHHQVARRLVSQYGMIAHEALNIQGLARSQLATSTHAVGWGHFLHILHRKAEGAGVRVIAVPPANTTQQCSACGALPATPEQRKTLGDRVHHCRSCGYIADRDHNAAQNILRLGRSLQASTWPVGACLADALTAERFQLIDRQLSDLLRRHNLVHHAVVALYLAVLVFVVSMFVIARALQSGSSWQTSPCWYFSPERR